MIHSSAVKILGSTDSVVPPVNTPTFLYRIRSLVGLRWRPVSSSPRATTACICAPPNDSLQNEDQKEDETVLLVMETVLNYRWFLGLGLYGHRICAKCSTSDTSYSAGVVATDTASSSSSSSSTIADVSDYSTAADTSYSARVVATATASSSTTADVSAATTATTANSSNVTITATSRSSSSVAHEPGNRQSKIFATSGRQQSYGSYP